MFKCAECGAKYENPPQYCDCGNDIFEEIEDIEIVPKLNKIPQIQKQLLNNEFVETEDIDSIKSPKSFDVLSVGIFLLCIIVAGILLFTTEKPQTEDKTPIKSQEISQNIPPVDSFWDDTPPAGNENETIEEKFEKIIDPITKTNQQPSQDPAAEKFEKWLNSPKKLDEQPQKITYENQTKTKTPKKPAVSQAPAAKTTSNTQTAAVKVNSPQQPDNIKKELLSRVQKNAQNSLKTQSQTPNTVHLQPQKTSPQPAQKFQPSNNVAQSPAKPELRNATHQILKTQAEIKQEVDSYKASLRNTIGKKINFANVVGDGSCAISFGVDSSGKLINRKFSKQSSNITLNDAVYSAMMSTPTFRTPPEGYKGETLTLNIKFYNGNFEISLN